MNEKYLRCYETLGLEPGAGPEAVKKAYFRLVRKYPPEKEPERFQTIRAAYEALKDGPPPEREDAGFPLPEDPTVRLLAKHAASCSDAGDPDTAAELLDQALEFCPGDPGLLLLLARVQLEADKPRKAYKTALQLLEKAPDCGEAAALAAMGAYRGSWRKKSMPLFQRALDAGVQGKDFLFLYADALEENGQTAESDAIRLRLLRETAWKKDELEMPVSIFIKRLICPGLSGDGAVSLLEEYAEFLRKNRRSLRDVRIRLAPLAAVTQTSPELLGDPRVYRLAEQMAGACDAEQPGIAEELRIEMARNAMENDARFTGSEWARFADVMLDDDWEEKTKRFAALDLLLCLMKERQDIRADVSRIRSDHPYLAGRCGKYLKELSAEDTAGLFETYKREYARLAPNFDGGFFFSRYPEEKILPRGVLFHGDDQPYVRQGKKVGRNDPCPCGSGKKFKRCCMGKGIYD